MSISRSSRLFLTIGWHGVCYVPAGLLVLDQLHGWLRDTRPVARWVFIGLGVALDPTTAFELRQLRATNRRQAKELDMLKKAIASCLL